MITFGHVISGHWVPPMWKEKKVVFKEELYGKTLHKIEIISLCNLILNQWRRQLSERI